MLNAWGRKKQHSTIQSPAGDLTQAVRQLRRRPYRKTSNGRALARELTTALIERANRLTTKGNLRQAWDDLYSASDIVLPADSDRLAREKTHLVELTVEQANSQLCQAKITAALDTIAQIRLRNIQDWRADQIYSTSTLIQSAEEAAAQGKLSISTQQLDQARSLRPDLDFLNSRKKSYQTRLRELESLNDQLRKSFADGQWAAAKVVAGKILSIAPKNKIALDANRQCDEFARADKNKAAKLRSDLTFEQIADQLMQDNLFDDDATEYSTVTNSPAEFTQAAISQSPEGRKAMNESQAEESHAAAKVIIGTTVAEINLPDGPPAESYDELKLADAEEKTVDQDKSLTSHNLTDTHYHPTSDILKFETSHSQNEPHRHWVTKPNQSAALTLVDLTSQPLSTPRQDLTSKVILTDDSTSSLDDSDQPSQPETPPLEEFLLWVDGVGGYLVCPAPINTIGGAVDQPEVEIPILGDVRQEHARVELLEGQHLLHAIAGVTIEGQAIGTDSSDAVVLNNGDLIKLDGGVDLTYVRKHPLSPSARLDFASRHRTRPWSDGVILAAQSFILGPDRRNQIVCSFWRNNIVFFRRGNQWFIRTEGKVDVDGVIHEGTAPIRLDSRVIGADFSFSVERATT